MGSCVWTSGLYAHTTTNCINTQAKGGLMIEKIILTIMVLMVAIFVGYFILEHEISVINELTEFCENKSGVLNFHGSEVNCTKINDDGITVIMSIDNKNKSWGDLK